MPSKERLANKKSKNSVAEGVSAAAWVSEISDIGSSVYFPLYNSYMVDYEGPVAS